MGSERSAMRQVFTKEKVKKEKAKVKAGGSSKKAKVKRKK